MRRVFLAAVLACCLVVNAPAERWPDGYPIRTGSDFCPLYPDNPDRPAWLFSTGRALAKSRDGTREWVVYEAALDRRGGFHQMILEVALCATPSDLYVRLLDADRKLVVADVFGNIPSRAPTPGNVFLTVPLTIYPQAAVIQVLIPAQEESALSVIMLSPASYEVLYKSAGDFVSANRAWIRTPVFDSKNVAMLSDLVLLEEGQAGDLATPISSFRAYGVDSRILRPERIEGAETVATFALDAMPLLARFDVLMQHVDPIHAPEVWLNGVSLGPLSLDLPDLEDVAYQWDDEEQTWRIGRLTRAWFFIPADALRIGDNMISLSPATASQAGLPPLATSGIQFKYPWEEIGTYSFVTSRVSTRDEPIAGNISPAPVDTTVQDSDVFVFRTDESGYRPLDASAPRPGWLLNVEQVDTDPAKKEKQFIIALNPTNRPARLGLDIIVLGGPISPATVSLWQGNRLVAPDILTLNLDCRYKQCGHQLMVSLDEYPEADTVRLDVRAVPGLKRAAAVSRLQLRAVWPAAVVALGAPSTSGSLENILYDARSALVPAEVLTPSPSGGAVTQQLIRATATGEWYGVETRMLETNLIMHGDARARYFSEWMVPVDQPPLLARVDLLVLHVCATDGLELFVNGERVGPLTLHLPGLQDANYMVFHVNRISADGTRLTNEERYAIDYGAWARASIVFDGRLLKPGINKIAIGRTPRLKGTNDHYSMKQIRLQLKYTALPAS